MFLHISAPWLFLAVICSPYRYATSPLSAYYYVLIPQGLAPGAISAIRFNLLFIMRRSHDMTLTSGTFLARGSHQ
ncbi:hypothetical protein BDZ94DRAFT_1257990 [Collybia nuda]|uniref:Uncharacterized protein n=1 Tax=Collybia nuda TaxID=64659 RepID=A0A9P5Y5N5_9AGAR|nr:hypothetical protein BDZ94DRAFT_1257990 [Collybia nuda]